MGRFEWIKTSTGLSEMNTDQFTSPIAREKRETTFWQGVACGLAVAIAILLVVIVRLV